MRVYSVAMDDTERDRVDLLPLSFAATERVPTGKRLLSRVRPRSFSGWFSWLGMIAIAISIPILAGGAPRPLTLADTPALVFFILAGGIGTYSLLRTYFWLLGEGILRGGTKSAGYIARHQTQKDPPAAGPSGWSDPRG